MKRLGLFLFLFSSALFADTLTRVETDLNIGDEFYDLRGQIENAYKAQALYKKHFDNFPKDPEGLWRMSMVNYYIGHLTAEKKQRMSYFRDGVNFGERCVSESESKMVQCFFWLATNKALLQKDQGILNLAFGIGGLIDLFSKALTLDPLYAGAGPHRMLGLLYYKAPGFLGGDDKKGYFHINEAIKLKPDEPLNYYFYIKFLINDDKTEQALLEAKDFISKRGTKPFEFFESQTAFNNINYFIQNKKLPANND